MKLSTQPYKGARDFYPEDKRKQSFMFRTVRRVVKRYGYEEYDAPIIEPLEIYKAKSGQEIVNDQTYIFNDRGGREVAIRPEMTPTVSRMVAAKRQELAYPLRWFSIPNLWRYERAQRGRFREHWQLNVDIFGVSNYLAEVELINLVSDIFKEFKATDSMYEIKINHRGLINFIFTTYLGLSEDQSYAMAKLIDHKNKITEAQFLSSLDDILTPNQRQADTAEKMLNLFNIKQIDQLPELIIGIEPINSLKQTITTLNEAGINNISFDLTLMRGFDYYSGIVFEVFDTHPDNNRSMMGGGRYDGLVGLFGVDPIATAGFGLGDATLANFLDLHGLMPELLTETDIYAVIIGDNYLGAQKAVNKLRDMGANVAADLSAKKVGTQLKAAQKKGIRFAVFIGENELSTDQYTLRDMLTAKEEKHSLERIISIIFDHRSEHFQHH